MKTVNQVLDYFYENYFTKKPTEKLNEIFLQLLEIKMKGDGHQKIRNSKKIIKMIDKLENYSNRL